MPDEDDASNAALHTAASIETCCMRAMAQHNVRSPELLDELFILLWFFACQLTGLCQG